MEQVKQFFRRHPDAQHYSLCAATLGTGLALAALILTIFSPYAGEITSNFLIEMGFYINLAAGAMAVLMLVAFFVWNFGKGIQFTTPDVSGLLAASNWVEPTIGHDTLICLRPGESEQAFYARKQQALADADPAHWAVIIPFQIPLGMMHQGGTKQLDIDRGNPPFADNLADDHKITPGIYFSEETRQQYEHYLEWFAYHFKEWAAKSKVLLEENKSTKSELFDALIKPSVNILLFLLFALGLSAQGSADINRMLGKNAGIAPGAGMQVEIMFERGKSHFRTGNGKSTVTELLEGVPGFKYPKAAPVAVIVGDRIVARANSAQSIEPTTRQGAMRPVSALSSEEAAPQSSGFSLPDSASIASSLDSAGDNFDFYRTEFWKSSRPIWGFLMRIFWGIIPVFVCIGFIAKYIASTGNEEDFYGISLIGRFIMGAHESASGVSLLICWGITIVAFINEFMWLVYTQRPLWLMLVFLFPTYWLAKWLTNWWVPNPPGSRGVGGKPSRRGNYDPSTLQIPSGR